MALHSVWAYLAFMFINYIANAVVLGVPAWRGGLITPGRAAKDLIGYTLLGQLADAIGLTAGTFLSLPVTRLLGAHGGSFDIIARLCQFVGAGAAIAFLVRKYLGNRWALPDRTCWGMMAGAAILTNPAIVIALLPEGR